ncbi:CPBP family intramembrane metalloprotease [Pseudooceanicola sp. CBS1P-1]|uniref:CPBP family intramembrane metalloprotease n=1 Tax=Pseudooceanicola albus TaxID=2692189 RepID=A0A6L7G6F6_9RHOB|nr:MULTISPECIES: CPBP family intramembrane glutamic endopeptidase [Pseudooceanicola]MBT9384551.1 CPBP family intramembrane metalloprotease [Pseudooceanicola endophyticus]MXN18253.1 CPBP family intramembrane metalloprotease [Pseudooceanicola albus]
MAEIWPDILTWLAFLPALLLAWGGHRRAALILLGLSAVLALASGVQGALTSGIFALCLLAAAQIPRLPEAVRPVAHAGLILTCLALGLGLVPGSGRLTLLSDIRTGPESLPFSYGVGLAKPFTFFLLLWAWPGLLEAPGPVLRRGLGAALLGLAGVFALALAGHVIAWEPTLPGWLPLFLLGNLLLTCLPEEAFFRGYLQQGLMRRLGLWPGLGLSGLLFGAAHLGGGLWLAGLAVLAGLAYGLAYRFGGGLRAAVACHFGFNLVHLLLFTYPAAA